MCRDFGDKSRFMRFEIKYYVLVIKSFRNRRKRLVKIIEIKKLVLYNKNVSANTRRKISDIKT